ncbi:AMP-binding protein [Methylobacterium persicinum]|uniref:AMP-dependent synthetase/ligase domain-containing protein n=1 Tax=Methylobacterium persicinum TaxID=374426 RepID=A0ABU0HK63_9HYPH|nr:AMP-binding protein [Methylobacterium persicinum]MDQ0442699.1 hypothetical protein [Methylobacterium persicinum]GJE37055.1 hypothetical protein KHHGKMAE_1110 [Methylobacterium persicinum]
MNAQAAHLPAPPAVEPLQDGLASALFAAARLHPQRVVFRDAGDRRAWCGRPPITWTYETAAEIVGRLARGILAWRLPLGSRIGLSFAGGAEASLAHLAVEAAGHLPCPLSPLWDTESLSVAIEAAGLVGILTEGRRGSRRPADELAHTALRHFSLRFIAAFGPGLPDGVISLDAMALERGIAEPRPGDGFITFAGGDPRDPVRRDAPSFAALVAGHRERLRTPERVLTLLPAHDLRGLVTGLGTALASSATLETLIPFDVLAFQTCLLRPIPTRLVVPGAFESALSGVTLPWTVRAIDVVHRAPVQLPEPGARDVAGPPCHDVLVLDEDAVLTRPRGRWEIPVDDSGEALGEFGAESRPLVVRRTADNRLLSRTSAYRTAPSQRGTAEGIWQETDYCAGGSPASLLVRPAP